MAEAGSELDAALERELDPGEVVLWVGRPDGRDWARRVRATATSMATVGILGFVVVGWGGVQRFWRVQAVPSEEWGGFSLNLGFGSIGEAAFYVLAPLLCLAYAVWMWRVPGRERRIAAGTLYALTSTRAIIVTFGHRGTVRLMKYPPDKLAYLFRQERSGGVGDIVFEAEADARRVTGCGTDMVHGFIGIPGVAEVERLIRRSFDFSPRLINGTDGERQFEPQSKGEGDGASATDRHGHGPRGDPSAASMILGYLDPGERLLWASRPDARILARRIRPRSVTVAALFFAAGAGLAVGMWRPVLAWWGLFQSEDLVSRQWGPVVTGVVAGAIFLFGGSALALSSLRAPLNCRRWAERTIYAVTTKRGVTLHRGGDGQFWMRSYQPDELLGSCVRRPSDVLADLVFKESPRVRAESSARPESQHAFLAIPDFAEVERMIRRTFGGAGGSENGGEPA
jgi:hypothetical protein